MDTSSILLLKHLRNDIVFIQAKGKMRINGLLCSTNLVIILYFKENGGFVITLSHFFNSLSASSLKKSNPFFPITL